MNVSSSDGSIGSSSSGPADIAAAFLFVAIVVLDYGRSCLDRDEKRESEILYNARLLDSQKADIRSVSTVINK